MSADPGEVFDWLRSLPGSVRVAYEAGPTGYGLARFLHDRDMECLVAAPSKLQRPSGDRVKTDRRDARHLAKLVKLDEIVPVRIPSVEQEAARDLVRARDDAREDLMRARHRVSKLLLRHGMVYSGGSPWTGKHDAWLRTRRFDAASLQHAFDAGYEAMLMTLARRDRLDAAIEALAADSDYTPVMRRLGCLRGISLLTGFGLAVEIGDWHRLTGASIGAYLGLVPSEQSSGSRRAQGSVTKAGNKHARRLLVEAAWHHRKHYKHPSKQLRNRWAQADPAAQARGHAGNQRLHQRWRAFDARQKQASTANAAIARELAGWCWSLATLEPQPEP
jgi:transposase